MGMNNDELNHHPFNPPPEEKKEDRESWHHTPPSFVQLSAVLWILVAGAIVALLAFVAYRILQNPVLAEQVRAFFARSSTANFLFWILAGLIAGFVLIGACELFSICGGRDEPGKESQDQSNTMNSKKD